MTRAMHGLETIFLIQAKMAREGQGRGAQYMRGNGRRRK
jgi:hypothetical protein